MAATPDKKPARTKPAAETPKAPLPPTEVEKLSSPVSEAEVQTALATVSAPFSLIPVLAGVSVTLSGLEIAQDAEITVAQYEEMGRGLAVMDGGLNWVMADYFNLGEDRFESEALDVLERLGLADKTISNLRWVARKIPVERRRPELRFTHHAEVAGLEPEKADELLEQAVQEKWSAAKLRDEARIALKGDAVVLPPPPPVQTAISDAVETAEAAEIESVPEGAEQPVDAPKDDFAAPLGGGLQKERGEPVVIRNQAEAKGAKPTPAPAPQAPKPAPAPPPAPAKPREPVTVHGPFYRANYTLKGGGAGGKDKVLQFELWNTPEGDWEIFCDGKTFTKVGLQSTAVQKVEEYCHECKVAVEEARKNLPAGKQGGKK